MKTEPKNMPKQHRILLATDCSPSAQAALATAAKFPWPRSSRAQAVVARLRWLPSVSEEARAAAEASFEEIADTARGVLTRRWPEAKIVFIDEPPGDAILDEATRFKASLIVLGWRGHGTFRRLLAGSVSRRVAAHAQCPVLVVREPAKAVRRFVVGFDGCPNSKRALEFLSSLEPGRGNRVVLVNVVHPVQTPASIGRFPRSMRASINQQVAALSEAASTESYLRRCARRADMDFFTERLRCPADAEFSYCCEDAGSRSSEPIEHPASARWSTKNSKPVLPPALRMVLEP